MLELSEQRTDEVRRLIFNNKVKNELDLKISKIKNDIENKTKNLPDIYQKALIELMNKFL